MENTLLIVIDLPKYNKYFLKLYENYLWYRKYWNERHKNMRHVIDHVKNSGGKIMWANYVKTDPDKVHKSLLGFHYDLTHNEPIPPNTKTIYLIGESLDICIMNRPLGYIELSKKFDVSVILDACIVGEKISSPDWVIAGKKCNINRREIRDTRYKYFLKYHEMFCNTNKIKYMTTTDFLVLVENQ
jgi:hypothetical protein